MTGALTVGIDVGGTKILGRLVDVDEPLRPVAQRRVDTPRGAPAILASVHALIDELVREGREGEGSAAGSGPDIGAIGLGLAGQVDLHGVLRYAPNLPAAIDFDPAPDLAARWSVPVVVDNDANCAAWAEHRLGAARGVDLVTLVTLGTGIGCGIVLGGELQRGAAGMAGEPGHMVVDPAGPPCPCGRRGCWERFASGSGLGRLARDAAEAGQADRVVALAGGGAEDVRGEHVTRAALEGDADALAVMEQFAWWVALGVANLVNVLDPEMIVIGGGLAEAGDLLLVPARRAYAGLVLAHDHRPPVRIVGAELGPEAGAIGAALLAAERPERSRS